MKVLVQVALQEVLRALQYCCPPPPFPVLFRMRVMERWGTAWVSPWNWRSIVNEANSCAYMFVSFPNQFPGGAASG